MPHEYEPAVRTALSALQNAADYAARLDRTDYGSALDNFEHHVAEAANQLRLWAQANGVEIRQGMPT